MRFYGRWENGTTGVLHAYDASNLSTEIYSSNTNAARDQFDPNKFVVPTIANGKVYVATPTGVAVFGSICRCPLVSELHARSILVGAAEVQ